MPNPLVRAARRAALLVLPVVLLAPAARGQATASSGHPIPVPSAHAIRRAGAIAIDGQLDDAIWKSATPVAEFLQVDPDEARPATQRTEMRFVFDDDALYVGAKMYDSLGSAGVRTSLVRRDQDFNSDYIEIVIDGYHDHLGRAFFQVNPSGVKNDQLGIGTSCCDEGWDPIWEASTHIDADGWTAEVRIPLNQLRFSRDSVQTWGLQLRRFIHRRNELDQWAFWRRNEAGGPPRFGHLEGLRLGRPSGHLEVLPYLAAKTQNIAADAGDPFNSGNVSSARVGMDLKYSLSSNLTLDATVNPDFGQVEVDPAVINLSDVEVSFDEKRPFFVASSGVFGFGGFSCFFCSNVSSLSAFYSRRIGRAPTGTELARARGKYVDLPPSAAILGAAKVTGRTSNGFTVGLLDAVTNRETARFERGDGTRGHQEVEPFANYFVGRLKKDFLDGNLVVGAIGTSVVRSVDSAFASRLTTHAEVVGSDMLYTWKNRTYSLQGNFALSSIEGDARVIAARQRSSARYFQRPDRGARSSGFLTNRYDTTATALRGAGAYLRIAKDVGNWMWESAVNTRTPGFEVNDLAFLTRTDYVWYNANVNRFWSTPTSWYRRFTTIAGGQQQQNYDGDITDRQLHLFVSSTTPQFWEWSGFSLWRPAVLDDRLLRGGPAVVRQGTRFIEARVASDGRRPLVVEVEGSHGRTGPDGRSTSIGVELEARPTSSVRVSFEPSWDASVTRHQYVTAVSDPTATEFFGKRYVVSSLRQRQLVLETRLNMTFTPTMTLELFVQPLIGSGQYDDFKEFRARREGSTAIYGRDIGTVVARDSAGRTVDYTIDPDGAGAAAPFTIDNPDFNSRSLRGNAVFRWEYRPGSVLYVAWTHSRAGEASVGDFRFSRDWNALLDSRPDNILLVKASWWLAK
jgi:uncharacterized protein DUF5916/cellulose/xylan binding protein with CBM9 domain